MKPDFAPQILVVILILGSYVGSSRSPTPTSSSFSDRSRGLLATSVCLGMVLTTLFRCELYPFSTISMYSIPKAGLGYDLNGNIAFLSESHLNEMVSLCTSPRMGPCYSMFFTLNNSAPAGNEVSPQMPFVLKATLYECSSRQEQGCIAVLRDHCWRRYLPQCRSSLEKERHYIADLTAATDRMETEIIRASMRQLHHERTESRDGRATPPGQEILEQTAGRWLAQTLCEVCETRGFEDDATCDSSSGKCAAGVALSAIRNRTVSLELGVRVVGSGGGVRPVAAAALACAGTPRGAG